MACTSAGFGVWFWGGRVRTAAANAARMSFSAVATMRSSYRLATNS